MAKGQNIERQNFEQLPASSSPTTESYHSTRQALRVSS